MGGGTGAMPRSGDIISLVAALEEYNVSHVSTLVVDGVGRKNRTFDVVIINPAGYAAEEHIQKRYEGRRV